MLKKIPVNEVRLGMHLVRLDGAWLDHPFWRTRFTVEDPEDLAKLHRSAVTHCWIDEALGRVRHGAEPALPSPMRGSADGAGAHPPRKASSGDAPATQMTHLSEELNRAAGIVKRSRSTVDALFAQARLGNALDAESCLPLVEEIAGSVMRNPGALVSLARLKSADDYSYMHSVAVCALMVALARQLDFDEAGCRDAGLAGLLHDLGKAQMPLEVLNKPGPLDKAEFEIMKTHAQRGFDMLQEARGASASAMEVCMHHHERPDGKGYPHGLEGDAVTRLARMGAVCDVYDAITSNRPYKAGWDPAESIAQMVSWQGQFDPDIMQAFVRSLGIYPTGSLVKLASGKLAVVLEQNPQSLVSPVVRVFYSTQSQMPVPSRRLDLAAAGCQDRIVGRESPQRWGFKQIDDLWLDGDLMRRSR